MRPNKNQCLKSIPFIVLLISISFALSAQVIVPGSGSRRTFFTNGTNNFTVPANVTMIYFEACSGGGGKGGRFFSGTDYKWGGGGGGGAFYKGYLTVSAGQILAITIGGPGTNGTDGTNTTTFAMPGNNGGQTSIALSGTSIFSINGGTGGNPGSGTAAGTAGTGGGGLIFNSNNCTTLSSYNGMGGFPGITSPTPNNDYSGVGGSVGKLGDYNYLFPAIHFVEPAASGTYVYYLAPYCGNGSGRGTPSSGGYVYLYW